MNRYSAIRNAKFLVAFWIIPLLLGACNRGGNDLNAHLDKGHDFLESGHHEDAQLEGLYVLLREPESEEALHLVALSLLKQGRDGEAEGYFRTLAAISPAYAREAAGLYDELAQDDFRAGQTGRAARRWDTALGFHPLRDLGPYAFFVAERAYGDRQWQRVATLYASALEAFPDTSAVRKALYPYAVSLRKLERWRESLEMVDTFLKRYPRSRERHEAIWLLQETLLHEAKYAREMMDYDSAVSLLKKVLKYRDNPPKTCQALLELGLCHEARQEYQQAMMCYRRVIEEETEGQGRFYDSAIEGLEKLEKARLN